MTRQFGTPTLCGTCPPDAHGVFVTGVTGASDQRAEHGDRHDRGRDRPSRAAPLVEEGLAHQPAEPEPRRVGDVADWQDVKSREHEAEYQPDEHQAHDAVVADGVEFGSILACDPGNAEQAVYDAGKPHAATKIAPIANNNELGQ
jgi:hypothetical protein